MRTRYLTVIAALLLTSARPAWAQAPQQQPAPAAVAPALGSLDVGVRGSNVDGDEARFERYRDLRNGAPARLTISRETSSWIFGARAENAGYRDQRYNANYMSSKVKALSQWDSIPLNYSYLAQVPWQETSPGAWTLNRAAREAVQNRTAVGIPCAPPTTCTNPTTAATTLSTPSVYRALATGFDLQQRRDAAGFDLTVHSTEALDWTVGFTTTKKSGHQPFGMSFAFNNANELAIPLDQRTNDFTAGLEWANPKGMFRVGWDGSWFDNRIESLVWDNPLRATDYTGANGLWDPSGYSNGNGPAQGRISLPPSNSQNVISTTGLYKMARHSTVNGIFSFTANRQDADLIPWTTNQVILQNMPFFQRLERTSAEAKVRGINAAVNFNSRPTRLVGITARYRYNDHTNTTPPFDGTEYVRFDAVPEETGGLTEPHNIRRNTFDANVSFNLVAFTALRAGYGYDHVNRTGRAYSGMADNTFRVSLDTTGNPFVTVRGIYEYVTREGHGFSESAIEDGGAQPGLRYYDEANRTRHRGTLVAIVNPIAMVDLTASFSGGKDAYGGPGHDFGLLDNSNTAYNVSLGVTPRSEVALGVSYGREKYSAFQKSRNANPPADPSHGIAASDYGSWFDPNRDWTLDQDETVDNLNVYLDLIRAVPNTEIRFGWDFSDSDNAFVHGGPRIQELRTNAALSGPSAIVYPGFTIPIPCSGGVTSCFEQLPPATNQWNRATVDLRYFFTTKLGVGVSYWYEKLEIRDFATVNLPGTETPQIDYLGGLTTGYGNRPYEAHTGFVRLLFFF